MSKNKLKIPYIIQVLKSLNSKEYKRFLLFLSNDFFNQNKQFVVLTELFHKHINNNSNYILLKQNIFSILYPKEKFYDLKLRHSISNYKKLLNEFLIVDYSRNNNPLKANLLLYILRSKNLKYNYSITKKNIDKNLKNIPKNNLIDSTLERFFILKEEYEFIHHDTRTDSGKIDDILISLTEYYILEYLRVACNEWINTHDKIKLSHFKSRIHLLLSSLHPSDEVKNPLLMLYLNLFKILYEHDLAIYSTFFKQLESLENIITQNEQKNVFLILISFSIRKSNEGSKEMGQNALDLYLLGLKSKVLLENDIISRYTYKNVISIFLVFKKFKEAIEFLEFYKKLLPAEFRTSSYQYNLGSIYFAQGDYEKAMQEMANTKFVDVYDNLRAKGYLLICYYENKEMVALKSLLNSFELFVKRRRNLGALKDPYLKMISFVKRLVAIDPKEKAKVKALKKDIDSNSFFPGKAWLETKLKNISSSKY